MKIGDHFYIDPEAMLKPHVGGIMTATIEGEEHKVRLEEVHVDGTCKVKVIPNSVKE